MEPASDLISRPLPHLTTSSTLPYEPLSTPTETVSARYFYQWPDFEQDAVTACASLDLTTSIPVTGEADMDDFLVARKAGLLGGFTKHVCDPVTKGLSGTPLSHLKFGDYNFCQPKNTMVPDVALFNTQDSEILAVGYLIPFRALRLENYPVNQGYPRLVHLQQYFGPLIEYMRLHSLKYGFLSTYKSTVFVRRTDEYRFELSMPIDQSARNPSLRQCFTALCVHASNSAKLIESPTFYPEKLGIPMLPLSHASPILPPRPNCIVAVGGNINTQTIIFGGDNGVATSFVNCERLIRRSKSRDKSIYEVTWDGKPAVAKCWSPELYQNYAHETMTYEKIYEHAQRSEGYNVFASMLGHGKICCSSVFPNGYILILSKVPGETLDKHWDSLPESEMGYICSQVRRAIEALRSFSVLSVDSGKHNVLYDPGTRAVTMVDFELMQACEEDTLGVDMPEMYAIFSS